MIRSVGIFCGSSSGTQSIFTDSTEQLVELLCRRNISIIYGGGNTGLMGVVAQTAKKNNGKLVGVVPRFFVDKQVVCKHLDQLVVVDNIQVRKLEIINRSDAFVILPGGVGTADEFFDAYASMQLLDFKKPIAIFNIDGYYDYLLKFIEQMVNFRFLLEVHFKALIVESKASVLVEKLLSYQFVQQENWIENLRKNNTF